MVCHDFFIFFLWENVWLFCVCVCVSKNVGYSHNDYFWKNVRTLAGALQIENNLTLAESGVRNSVNSNDKEKTIAQNFKNKNNKKDKLPEKKTLLLASPSRDDSDDDNDNEKENNNENNNKMGQHDEFVKMLAGAGGRERGAALSNETYQKMAKMAKIKKERLAAQAQVCWGCF